MRRMVKEDKSLIIDLLSGCFDDNKSVNSIVQQDSLRKKRIRHLMAYSIEVCLMFGEVWLSEDRKACALITHPHKKKTTFSSILLDLKLILSVIGVRGIFKTLKRERLVSRHQPKIPMTYVWFIGVEPGSQNQGVGSALLQHIIDESTRKNLPVYLETSTLTNVRWYQRFGFEIYYKLELRYPLYFFRHVSC